MSLLAMVCERLLLRAGWAAQKSTGTLLVDAGQS